MKLNLLFMTVFILQVSASTFGQKVTLMEKNTPLIEVIDKINSQTGYDFVFATSAMKTAKPVNLTVTNLDLLDALRQIFSTQPLSFFIKDKSIVIALKSDIDPREKIEFSDPAKDGIIHGWVTDSLGQAVGGATVLLENSKFYTQSDKFGQFKLTGVPVGKYNIIVTFIGFARLRVPVNVNGQDINVRLVMHPVSSQLDQVKVIGYGTTTQRYSVGSVSSVSADEIAQQPVTNVLQALEGRVPGLVVNQTNGAPGSVTLTQIRGQNTLANTPALKYNPLNFNQPLYIVDGVPIASQNSPIQDYGLNNGLGANIWATSGGLSPLNTLNPNDIESISILKDADATSIYGSQGSNGVILITTKRGKPGSDRIGVSFRTGATNASRTVKMMNTAQYLEMRKEALVNTGLTANLNNNDADLLLFDQTLYKDYVKDFYGGTAHHTDLNVSLSGGSENTTYLVNLGSTHQGYNFPGDFADNRLSMHSSFNHRSKDKKFTLDFGTDYSYDKNNSTGAPQILSAFALPPNMPDLIDGNGDLVWSYKGYSYANSPFQNPLAYLKQTAYTSISNLNSHIQLGYQILPELKIGVTAGYSRVMNDSYAAFPKATQVPEFGILGYANWGDNKMETINIEPQLNYTKRISRGTLNFLLGGTYRKNTANGASTFVYGYSNDALLNSVSGGTSPTVSNNGSIYKYDAGFARLNYIWESKYILNVTANRNGSSNFGPDRRIGTFGSGGLGWILSEENFMKGIDFLSYAKISGNYGTSGSDGVAPYQYQPNWAAASSASGYQGLPGLYPVNPLNPTYAWSMNKKFNETLELGFFQNRILMEFTAYQNKASQQLVGYNQPIQTGFSTITANAPYVIGNKGIELSITSRNIVNENFQWTSSFNISHNENKLLEFPDLEFSSYANSYILGKSVNSFQLVPFLGVDPVTGIFTYRKANGTVTNAPNVTSGFNNVKGDATELVDLNPKFTGGLSNTFTYKGISLSLFFQFAKQMGQNYLYSIYGNGITQIPGSPNVNQPEVLTGRWQKPGDISPFQRYSEGPFTAVGRSVASAASAFGSSTGAYSDASYIRLKTVSLAYTLPSEFTRKLHMKTCTVYMNAQNLFLITNYELGDPETQSLFNIPPQRTIVAGINVNF